MQGTDQDHPRENFQPDVDGSGHAPGIAVTRMRHQARERVKFFSAGFRAEQRIQLFGETNGVVRIKPAGGGGLADYRQSKQLSENGRLKLAWKGCL